MNYSIRETFSVQGEVVVITGAAGGIGCEPACQAAGPFPDID